MKIRPAGYFVLVEVEPIDETYQGTGILMPKGEQNREHGGRDIGKIISFGPLAFKGFDNCTGPEDWGVKEGDMVEFKRYDGKVPRFGELNEEFKNYRILIDNNILAVVEKGND